MVDRSATAYGAGGLPGCSSSPGAALRAVMRPVIGLLTMSAVLDLARRDDMIDLGLGLAENGDSMARCAQCALGTLLTGDRGLVVVLVDAF